MSDVWKSVPKKFCEICKCWFYDNKISIQHHEQGQRHKDNVQNKIRELGKKGRVQENEQREKINALLQMERGAMAAYKRDVAQAARGSSAYDLGGLDSSSSEKRPRFDEIASANTISTSNLIPGAGWYEARTSGEDGGVTASYFWNIYTNETLWQLPAGVPYTSLAEQEGSTPATNDTSAGTSGVQNYYARPPMESASSMAPQTTAPSGGTSGVQNYQVYRPLVGSTTTAVEPKAATQTTPKGQKKKDAKKTKPAAKNPSSPAKGPNTTGGNYRMSINVSPVKKSDPSMKPEKPESSASVSVGQVYATAAPIDPGKPYGDWQIVEKKVELRKDEFAYLPHNRWVKEESSGKGVSGGQADEGEHAEEDPKEKITFSERTAPSLGSEKQAATSGSVSFKKRKLPTAGRNLRKGDD